MGEEARFVARYASVYVTGSSFGEVGDVLARRGFNMTAARQTDHGVLIIPHKKPNRAEAHLFRELDAVTEEPKAKSALNGNAPKNGVAVGPENRKPMQVDVAAATFAGAKVDAGIEEGIGLQCRGCGAVHPEGVVCLVPIFFEIGLCDCGTRHLLLDKLYAHPGPHEAATEEGEITHRWMEELVVTDLPFDGYHPLTDDEREAF